MRKCFLFTILISLTFSDTERFNCFNELHNANEFSIINNVLDKHTQGFAFSIYVCYQYFFLTVNEKIRHCPFM